MNLNLKIPSTAGIIEEARNTTRKKSPKMLDPDFIRDNFSDSVEAIFQAAYHTYARYEKKLIDAITYGSIDRLKKDTFTKDDMRKIAREIADNSISLEKSLKQSRASRAGKSFEFIVQGLLSDVGIRSERVTKEDKRTKLRRIDLVIPDKKTAIDKPDKSHFLSLKTSLKERWMQVAEEQSQGQRTHLLTLLQKEILSNAVAQKIIDRGIFLYVPDRVKDDRFKDEPRIRRLSSLPSIVG